MSNTKYFDVETIKELGNYVYRLIDPRNGETFYVGKGKGNRVFAHVEADTQLLDDLNEELNDGSDQIDDKTSRKMERIHEIKRSGLETIHVIHRHGIPDSAVFEVEAALIDSFSGLTNVAGGHGSNDRGPMHAMQIIDKYQLPTIDDKPEHKLILININRFGGSSISDYYRQTQFCWRISQSRANKAEFVLSVIQGVVVAAFTSDRWDVATKKNFPDCPKDSPDRKAFEGKKAPDDIWDLYVGERGKRIANKDMKHVQNPIRYWNV